MFDVGVANVIFVGFRGWWGVVMLGKHRTCAIRAWRECKDPRYTYTILDQQRDLCSLVLERVVSRKRDFRALLLGFLGSVDEMSWCCRGDLLTVPIY